MVHDFKHAVGRFMQFAWRRCEYDNVILVQPLHDSCNCPYLEFSSILVADAQVGPVLTLERESQANRNVLLVGAFPSLQHST